MQALSFDVGGTFTDFTVVDLETREIVGEHKVLTNPDDPAETANEGWNALVTSGALDPPRVGVVVHSTTLVTNAVIERKGAATAFVTTAGFRDLLTFGREQMYDIYNLFAKPVDPIVEPEMRIDVEERITRDGAVHKPLDVHQLADSLRPLVERGIEAVAVGFLHSYLSDEHERQARTRILQEFPNLAVSISSETAPIVGEFERFTTTTVDAYVKKLVEKAINDLQAALAGNGLPSTIDLHIMTSAGGIVGSAEAIEHPVRLLESGPAAGALVAAFHGTLAGTPQVLSLDMGGTTAKACLIEHGHPDMAASVEAARVERFKPGSGLPVIIPVVDLIEIGAGGGSIASIDDLGLLKVGPESAGASPGPACYGGGGTEPTVTDANLLLGYLSADTLLGGALALDHGAAERAVGSLATELGLDLLETAWGIHRIANEAMAAAARMHAIEKNRDPRKFTLLAYGGAGPSHASAVAEILGMTNVIFPPGAGVASALGCLVAPPLYSVARSYPSPLANVDWETIVDLLGGMEREAARVVLESGVQESDLQVDRFVDLRLEGQFHELTIPLTGSNHLEWRESLPKQFELAYEDRYGTYLSGMELEVTTWRVNVRGVGERVELSPKTLGPEDATSALAGSRKTIFDSSLLPVATAVYDRDSLLPGMRIEGPAIVEETNTTIVIRPGDRAAINSYGAILVTRGATNS